MCSFWLCGSIVAIPIIYRLVPSPSRYKIRQCHLYYFFMNFMIILCPLIWGYAAKRLQSLHFKVNKKTKIFSSILGSCVFCAPLDRHISWHIDWHSTNVSVDISAECQLICWPTYRSSVGRYVDRDVSFDISGNISVEHRSICRLTVDQYVDESGCPIVRRHVDR